MNAIASKPLLLSRDNFEYFRSKIYEIAGISLSDAKVDLLQTRLRSRVTALGLESFFDYQSYLENLPANHDEWEAFTNLLTTNKTDWFREIEHFDFIVDEFLVNWKKLGKKTLNVWCAASSTGEEPYTLSLVLHHALKGTGIAYEIRASDIDTKVLEVAQNGVYPKSRLFQIPASYQNEGFCLGTGEIAEWMKVRKEIKAPVSFKPLNLSHQPYGWDVEFDLVLCRNVLIYFNADTIKKVVEGIYQSSTPNGVLIIAHSETLQNLGSSWAYFKPSIYQKGKLL